MASLKRLLIEGLREEARNAGYARAIAERALGDQQLQIQDLETELDKLETEFIKELYAFGDLQETAAEYSDALIYFGGATESLEQSLQCGARYMETLREDLSETQVGNDNLVQEIDESDEVIRDLRDNLEEAGDRIMLLSREVEGQKRALKKAQKTIKNKNKKAGKKKRTKSKKSSFPCPAVIRKRGLDSQGSNAGPGARI